MFLVSCFNCSPNHYHLHPPNYRAFYQPYKRVKALTSFQWNGFGPNRLLYTDIPLLDDKDCFNYKDSFDADHMICAGYLDVSFKQ